MMKQFWQVTLKVIKERLRENGIEFGPVYYNTRKYGKLIKVTYIKATKQRVKKLLEGIEMGNQKIEVFKQEHVMYCDPRTARRLLADWPEQSTIYLRFYQV